MPGRSASRCRFLAIAGVLLGAPLAVAQVAPQIFYVRESGNDANDGRSPARAFRTIQKGINSCTVPGSTVYVGPGRYKETPTLTISTKKGLDGNPFSVIGDGLGKFTLDTPGPVVIDGENNRQYGVSVQDCDNWHFENLTLQNQKNYGVYAYKAKGLALRDCIIDVPSYYGICLSDVGACDISGNQMLREANSGHCIYAYVTRAGHTSISDNRMSMTGSLYLSTGFRKGKLGLNGLFSGAYTTSFASYGVIAMTDSSAPTLTVQNNVVSDAYLGVYVYTQSKSSATKLVIANNTSVGCYYGLYAYAPAGASLSCVNNLVTDCYMTHYIAAPTASVNALMASSSVLTPVLQATLLASVITDTPKFKDAAGGDFSLLAGSRGIDDGVAGGAPTVDVLGRARPFDGNRDGTALHDIGAFESSGGSRIRIVRYRGINRDGEAEPAKDYEEALLTRLGTTVGTTLDTTLTKVDTTLKATVTGLTSFTAPAKKCSCANCPGAGCKCGCGGT